MIDHMSIRVSDYEKSKAFYVSALAPLGYVVVMEFHRTEIPSLPTAHVLGLGAGGKPDFWLSPADGPVQPTHVAFRADDRRTVEAFYEAATAAGGKDNGKPGLREMYHPSYYGAFVLDPDGYNIEAVCHTPE